MFKPSLGLGTKLGAALNNTQADFNVMNVSGSLTHYSRQTFIFSSI